MPDFDPTKYGLGEPIKSFDPSKYGLGKPLKLNRGDSPENPIDEELPDQDAPSRFKIMNLTANADQAVREIEKQGFKAKSIDGYNISIQSNKDNKWYKLDPSNLGLKESLKDIADITGGATNLAATTLGTIGGALGGSAILGPGGGTTAGAIAGSGLAAGGEEALRTGVIGPLFGLSPKLGEVAKAAGRESVYGALGGATVALKPGMSEWAKVVGKYAQSPRILEEMATREAAKTALRQGVKARDVSVMEREKALQEMRDELAGRESAFKEKLAKETTPPRPIIEEQIKREAPTVEGISAEDIAKLRAKEPASFTFLSGLLNPVYGITAKNLRKAPELKTILRHDLGEEFIPELGSFSMNWRDIYRKQKGREITQGEADIISSSVSRHIAEWIKGSERKGLLTEAEKETIERLTKGAVKAKDAPVINKIVERIIEGTGVKVTGANAAVREAIRDIRIAKGRLVSPPSNVMERIGDFFREEYKKSPLIIKEPMGAIGRGVNWSSRILSLPGVALEKFGVWLGKSDLELEAILKTAPPAVQNEIKKALKLSRMYGPDARNIALITALKIPAVREFIEGILGVPGISPKGQQNQEVSAPQIR